MHRILYTETVTSPYEVIIAALLDLDEPAEALEYAERAKSRALLELLAGRLADLKSNSMDRRSQQKIFDLLQDINELQKTWRSLIGLKCRERGKMEMISKTSIS